MKYQYSYTNADALLSKLAAVVITAEEEGLYGTKKLEFDREALDEGIKALNHWGIGVDPVDYAHRFLKDVDGRDFETDAGCIIEGYAYDRERDYSYHHTVREMLKCTLASCWIYENEISPIDKDEWLKSERFVLVMKQARKLYRGMRGHPHFGGGSNPRSSLTCSIEIKKYNAGFLELGGFLNVGGVLSLLDGCSFFHKDDLFEHLDKTFESIKSELRKKLKPLDGAKVVEQVED